MDAGGGGAVFTVVGNQGRDTVIEGFTITGGDSPQGGGITIKGTGSTPNCSPTISGNVITGNHADSVNSNGGGGGGVYILNGSPLLWNNEISYNAADAPGHSWKEGGGGVLIHCSQEDQPLIVWCNIFCNEVTGSSSKGGGVAFLTECDLWISHCWIGLNTAHHGGGIYGPSPYGDTPLLATVDCEDDRWPIINNCLISGNQAIHPYTFGTGGGIVFGIHSQPNVTNCTIVDNYADYLGDGIYAVGACVRVHNSILSSNDDESGNGEELYATGASDVLFDYTDVHGGSPKLVASGPNDIITFSTGDPHYDKLDDPLFRDSNQCDYHVQPASPAINAGSNNLLELDVPDVDVDGITAEQNPLDLDGRTRVLESVVDMGAYEHTGANCPTATILAATPLDLTLDARRPILPTPPGPSRASEMSITRSRLR